MLKLDQLQRLLSAITDDPSLPLRAISARVSAAFPGDSDRFAAGCALAALLQASPAPPSQPSQQQQSTQQQPLLTSAGGGPQRVAAHYVLRDMFPAADSPFAAVLLDALDPPPADASERSFLVQLLAPPQEQQPLLGEHSPSEVLAGALLQQQQQQQQPTTLPDVFALRQALQTGPGMGSAFRRAAVPRVLPDPDIDFDAGTRSSSHHQQQHQHQPSQQQQQQQVLADAFGTMEGLEPRWVRPLPPLLEVRDDEVAFVACLGEPAPTLAWDPLMCKPPRRDPELCALVAKAQRATLSPAQTEQAVAALGRDKKAVYHIGFGPGQVAGVVENNPGLAHELLLRMASTSLFEGFLDALTAMESSMHSMEVVSRLSAAVELPTEFIHTFVQGCIASCQLQADKYNQNRLVRLVCVFLQSLIRNSTPGVRDLFPEVSSFCLEFIKIREASALYRLIRALENSGDLEQATAAAAAAAAGDTSDDMPDDSVPRS